MTEEEKESGGIRENLRQGIGMLSAFKEAIEESIAEARERGDLSQERAREIMKSAVSKAQSAAEEARERFDLVAQRDFDKLVQRVQAIEAHLGLTREADDEEESAESPGEPDEPAPEEEAAS